MDGSRSQAAGAGDARGGGASGSAAEKACNQHHEHAKHAKVDGIVCSSCGVRKYKDDYIKNQWENVQAGGPRAVPRVCGQLNADDTM